jgi:hypothetical protein
VRAEVTAELEKKMRLLGATIVSTSGDYRSIIAWMPLLKLEQLAEDSAIFAIEPAARKPPPDNSERTSQKNETNTSFTTANTHDSNLEIGSIGDRHRHCADDAGIESAPRGSCGSTTTESGAGRRLSASDCAN